MVPVPDPGLVPVPVPVPLLVLGWFGSKFPVLYGSPVAS